MVGFFKNKQQQELAWDSYFTFNYYRDFKIIRPLFRLRWLRLQDLSLCDTLILHSSDWCPWHRNYLMLIAILSPIQTGRHLTSMTAHKLLQRLHTHYLRNKTLTHLRILSSSTDCRTSTSSSWLVLATRTGRRRRTAQTMMTTLVAVK